MATQTLYHGTSSLILDSIKANGIDSPYLTIDRGVAEYYAEEEAESSGGTPLVLVVTVDESLLKADRASFEEPLTQYRNVYAQSDEDWFEMLDDGSEICWPKNDNDWITSLDVVWSVRVDGMIPWEHIKQ